MAKLFEISAVFAQLFDEFDDMTEENGEEAEQAWFDTLEGIEAEFEQKVENVAQYIKSLKARAEAIKAEEKKLAARRKDYETKAECLKIYVKNCMEQMKLKKVETPLVKVLIRKNAPSLVIADESAFIEMLQELGRDDLLKYAAPEIRKNDVKALIKSGEVFEGAEITATESLMIG